MIKRLLTTTPLFWLISILVCACLVILFALHISHLPKDFNSLSPFKAYQSALAGEKFVIPRQSGWWMANLSKGRLLIGVDEVVSKRVTLSLCEQQANPTKHSAIIPIFIGLDWSKVKEIVAENQNRQLPAHFNLKNVLLDDPGLNIPGLYIDGGAEPVADLVNVSPLSITLLKESIGYSRIWLDEAHRPLSPAQETLPQKLSFNKTAWFFWPSATVNQPVQPDDVVQKQIAWWLGSHAVKLERTKLAGCRAGGLQVTHYHQAPNAFGQYAKVTYYPRFKQASAQKDNRHWLMKTGPYAIEAVPPVRKEDARLFNDAIEHKLIIERPTGELAIVPADWRYQFEGDIQAAWAFEGWQHLTNSQQERDIHKRLYSPMVGLYVRKQVASYNKRRLMAAIRFDQTSQRELLTQQGISVRTSLPDYVAPLPLGSTMPLLAGQLSLGLNAVYGQWHRSSYWPQGSDRRHQIKFTVPLRKPAERTDRLNLIVMGGDLRVTGGTIVKTKKLCPANLCRAKANVQQISIKPKVGVKVINLGLKPLDFADIAGLYRDEFYHIEMKGEHLIWNDFYSSQFNKPRADVKLRDRNNKPLLDSLQHSTKSLDETGLISLLGVDKRHESGLWGMLARLAEHDINEVDAKLSLDLELQTAAQQLLEQHTQATLPAKLNKKRISSLILMDAFNGEILAAAGTPSVDPMKNWGELVNQDALSYGASPLRVRAWQHDGKSLHAAGSTFKLITALALEQVSTQDPDIEQLLVGLTPTELNQYARAKHYPFNANATCYPADSVYCRWGNYYKDSKRYRPAISNHGVKGLFVEIPTDEFNKHNDDVYGLSQAIRDSMNSWFGFLVDLSDQTLLGNANIAGIAHTKAFTANALSTARPVTMVMNKLGFEQSFLLDGGLLPRNYRWRNTDVLKTAQSQSDDVNDRLQVLMQSIGLRMQVTPLQMAVVAASIAQEQQVKPRLLTQLNSNTAKPTVFEPLGINTSRIKQGMKWVPENGSAKKAFSAKTPAMAMIRQHLYTKTGTAPMSKQSSLNTAWLVGWLDAGVLEQYDNPIAFACMVSHSEHTGGKTCGALVAELFHQQLIDDETNEE